MLMSLRIFPNQRANNLRVTGCYSPANSPVVSPLNNGKVGEPSRCSVASLLRLTTSSIIFIFLLLVIFTACTAKSEGLDRIRDAGVLRIAIDPSFAPFEFVNGENELVGYDVDLALEIADALGVKAQFVTTGYDALFDALTVRRADIIISALYPDPNRSQTFVYSTPYFNAGDVLVVADHAITSWQSLGGKRIACIFGTTGHMTALEWQKTISPPPVVVAASSPLTLTNALSAGDLDAVLLDHVAALNSTQNMAGVQILPEMITDEPYVVASRIEDKALVEAIDVILGQLKNNGILLHFTDLWIHNHH